MNDLISIIVPVYNAEIYLATCIESILQQTYTNLEILLIDDGSTDASARICDNYAVCDKRIKVFHKDNQGIASARNIGLFHARGTYIAFCDDDYMHPNMLEYLYKAMIDYKVDIAMCQVFATYKQPSSFHSDIQLFPCSKAIKRNEELLYNLFNSSSDSMFINCNCVWNKLYSKKVISNVWFKDNGYEDSAFSCEIYCKIKDCVFIEYPLYGWVQHASSKSHYSRFDKRNYLGLYTHYKNLLLLERNGISNKIQDCCLYRIYKTLLQGKYYSHGTLWEKKTNRVVRYINKMLSKRFYTSKTISMKHKVAICLFFHFPALYSLFLGHAYRFRSVLNKFSNPNK